MSEVADLSREFDRLSGEMAAANATVAGYVQGLLRSDENQITGGHRLYLKDVFVWIEAVRTERVAAVKRLQEAARRSTHPGGVS